MSKNAKSSHSELNAFMEERGSRIFEHFGEEVLRGIEDPKMSTILRAVKDNRKDWLRPALTSFSCEAVGGTGKAADDAGLMFSLLSTGISIHDDIVDKSPRKHFRTTLLGKFGLSKCLLVGDLLIVKGWAQIGSMLQNMQDASKIALITQIYEDSCTQMCEAEFIENSYRKKLNTPPKDHERMLWKAMAETEACTRIGAIIGNGSDAEVKALAEFGRRIGFANRLVDELKDSLNFEGNLLHRIKYESVPLPLLFASKKSEETRIKIGANIKKSKYTPETIRLLLEICYSTGAFSYVVDLAHKNFDAANCSLDILEPSSSKDVLLNFNRKLLGDMHRICDYAGLEY